MNSDLEKQLSSPANFMSDGKLFLVRCMLCPDAGKKGKENWAPIVAKGQCAWCGWKHEKDQA